LAFTQEAPASARADTENRGTHDQPSTPRRSSCCDCPSSTAIDATAADTNATELPDVPTKPADTAIGPTGTHEAMRAPDGRCCSPSGPIRTVQSARSCALVCLSEPRSLSSGPGATSEAQGRRRPPRRCWPPHARAPDLCPWRPLVVAIRADPRRSKPMELRVHVLERTAQPILGSWGRQQGPGPTAVPPPLLAATHTSTRPGPTASPR